MGTTNRQAQWQRLVKSMIGRALAAAGDAGLGRTFIANRLDCSRKTVNAWVEDNRQDSHAPAYRFVQILVRDDVLPDDARTALWDELAKEAGFLVLPLFEVDPDEKPVSDQFLEVSTNVGRLAERIAEAHRELSEGGRSLSSTELDAIRDAARSAAVELKQLETTCELMLAD